MALGGVRDVEIAVIAGFVGSMPGKLSQNGQSGGCATVLLVDRQENVFLTCARRSGFRTAGSAGSEAERGVQRSLHGGWLRSQRCDVCRRARSMKTFRRRCWIV